MSGRYTRFGFVVALVACVLDQASKYYLLFVHDLAAHPIRLGPFFDFVLTRNTGISYGLFQTDSALGQWVLLGFKAAAVRPCFWNGRYPTATNRCVFGQTTRTRSIAAGAHI